LEIAYAVTRPAPGPPATDIDRSCDAPVTAASESRP
jgi:hypothetical protein